MQGKTRLSQTSKEFKYKQFEAEMILWSVRWYCQFAISYRDVVIMAEERGLSVAHTTVMRWVHEYAPKLEKKIKKHMKKSGYSYRIDETYIKIKREWRYLYRAVDSKGNTLDWMLSVYRNKKAAKKFFKKILSNDYCSSPSMMNVDKAKAFPPAFAEVQAENIIPINTKFRQQKYLNNIQEQEHRFIKRRIRQSQWFQSFSTAKKTIAGYETMHMIRKGQVKNVAGHDVHAQVTFINKLFGLAA
jgi:IS6 family transposase